MNFVFDLDGTICFDGENIPDKIITILKKARDYGHEVSFASARSYRDCIPVLKDDFKKNTIIALNGACIYSDEKLISYKVLDKDVYQKIIQVCVENDLAYFVDDYFNYTYNKPEEIKFFKYVDTFNVAKKITLEEMKTPVKMVIFTENKDIQDLIINLVKRSGKLSLMYHEGEQAIYINPCGIDKSQSIINHISKDYIAFGNDKNDIEMFKHAKYAVQIGDYSELIEHSNEQIFGDNLEEKIAQKIEKLFVEY